MANHGGARAGAGRKANAEKYAGPIAEFTDLCAGHAAQAFENLRRIADGDAARVESKWAPAGTLTRKDVARDVHGRALTDRNGKLTVIEVLLYPDLPADELVMVERKTIHLPPECRANEAIVDRFAGRPTQAVELGNGDDGPLKIVVEYADLEPPPAEAAPGAGASPPGDAAV